MEARHYAETNQKFKAIKSLTNLKLDLKPLSVLIGPKRIGKEQFPGCLATSIAHSDEPLLERSVRTLRTEVIRWRSFTFGKGGHQESAGNGNRCRFGIEVDVELSQNGHRLRQSADSGNETGDRIKFTRRHAPPVFKATRHPCPEANLRYRIEIENASQS